MVRLKMRALVIHHFDTTIGVSAKILHFACVPGRRNDCEGGFAFNPNFVANRL